MSDLKIIGPIPDDPRIHAAFEKLNAAGDNGITEAITARPPEGIERYGIKLRPAGLMHSAMLTRIMKKKPGLPEEFQAFIYIFTLGAPLALVYDALEVLEEKGFSAFMADVQNWFDTCGIPPTVSAEVVEAVSQTFLLAAKLLPKDEEVLTPEVDGATIKKNHLPGMQSPPTSSSPNTA